MELTELEELRDAQTVCNFLYPGGGCRGTVERVGAPASPNAVLIRTAGGTPIRVLARELHRS